MKIDSPVIIAGAGPAGATTSLFLCKNKIPHILLEKAKFPRDKICGDALSGKVVHVLNQLNPDFSKELQSDSNLFLGSHGVKFISPAGQSLDILFKLNAPASSPAPGFISRRIHFDDFLFRKIDPAYATILENTTIADIKTDNGSVKVVAQSDHAIINLTTNLVIGADGDRSVVAKFLNGNQKNENHYSAGIRAYYHGVTGFHPSNFIELHFVKELLPGYFWIFPLPDGYANAGIGVPSPVISRKKLNLRKLMAEIINDHPVISQRFKHAKISGEVKGWGLPLGNGPKKISGNRCLLTGDAASLIDPFTGEGIGNAMTSAQAAADIVTRAITQNRFDDNFLSQYDKNISSQLSRELSLSYKLQRLSRHPWLFNWIVKKAAARPAVRDLISTMFEDLDARTKLKNPWFYLELLTGRKKNNL